MREIEEDHPLRPITDILRDHRNGKLVAEASERFARVVLAVEETQKEGSITITLKVKPSKGEEGAFTVTPSLKTNVPERDLPNALFFSDAEGSLVRESPTQRGMFDVNEELGDAPRRRRSGED